MELFSVKRYDEQSDKVTQQNEAEILKTLMKKVDKRKRKFEKELASDKEELVDKSKEPKQTSEETEATEEDLAEENESPNDSKSPAEEVLNNEFKVLGDDVFAKKKKVEMILPPWLANPTVISTKLSEDADETNCIDNLPYISEIIKENLRRMNLKKLFPVQKEVIPWILEEHVKPAPFKPRDVCVSAPTGSGKTLAFAVPIVEILSTRVERKIRALIVLPVSELAQQVYGVFKRVASRTNLSVCLLSKSIPFEKEQIMLVKQFKGKYYSKVDIVVTTPGRLVEHMHSTKGFCLKNLKFLVIDEADRIMDQTHYNWLYHLDNHVRNASDTVLSGRSIGLCMIDLEGPAAQQPHKLLFSATLSHDPEKLQNLKLFQPKLFTSIVTVTSELSKKLTENISEDNQQQPELRGDFVGKYTTPAELTEQYCLTETQVKPLTLYSLIRQYKWKKFLCFANSAESAHRLAYILQFLTSNHLNIAELSASLSPKGRTHVLSEFALGKVNGLICSDALARGIDISEVDIVVSYDVPRHVNTYIHRIGRTARAGRPGTAITLLDAKELVRFKGILGTAGKDLINEIKVEGTTEEDYAKRYTKALSSLQKKLATEKHLKKIKKTAAKVKAVNVPSEMTLMEKLQVKAASFLESKKNEGSA